MDHSTQAHCLAKVFNSLKIKYLNKVLILVNKSGVLHFRPPKFVFDGGSAAELFREKRRLF
jgi:hypothetical protein